MNSRLQFLAQHKSMLSIYVWLCKGSQYTVPKTIVRLDYCTGTMARTVVEKKQKQQAFLYQGTVGGVWSEFARAAHDLFFKLSSDSMEKYCLCSFNFSKFNDTLPNDLFKIKAIPHIWSTMLSWLYVVRFTTLHDARTQRGSSFIYDCLPLLAQK